MNDEYTKLAHLCYEIGTLRKISRSHRQHIITSDISDNIGSHSHRVSCIAWLLAKQEGVDPYKAVTMAIFHDVPETRSGDQNWVHKRYVTVDEKEIIHDQFQGLPFPDLMDILSEYGDRESPESLVAKDADLLDQILLLREYAWAGDKEAERWLSGKGGEDTNRQIVRLNTESGKKLGEKILQIGPSEWWENLWTDKNRT